MRSNLFADHHVWAHDVHQNQKLRNANAACFKHDFAFSYHVKPFWVRILKTRKCRFNCRLPYLIAGVTHGDVDLDLILDILVGMATGVGADCFNCGSNLLANN